jgi:hypothetical protein
MFGKVSLFFDVEDPFGEFADDAALDVAQVFSRCGVRATFCVTGEKCRKLLLRDRTDVLDALAEHALGLHTNTHSQHPTTMELLEETDWDDGIEAAYASEKPGLDAFLKAFPGRTPSCWAGAGYTWGPQITAILPRLGIPSYVYALTSVGERRVHRFLDSLAFPITSVAKETEYEYEDSTDEAIARVLVNLRKRGGDWPIVFCGHPTKMRYSDYWDRAYYGGVTPRPYMGVEPREREAYERSLQNLERFIRAINDEFPVAGLDEAVALPWQFRELTTPELEVAETETVANIRWRAEDWPVHKPGLKTDRIEAETLARFDTLRVASL